jgi:hypothetical protein
MTVFTPQALLNLKKFRKKGKKDNSRNPNPKTPKMMGDTKKEGKESLSKKFEIGPGPSDNNFKREPFRPKPKVQPMRRKGGAEGSPFKKAIKQIMEKREPGGRFSKADRELAKNMLKKRRGGAMLKNPGKADLNKDGKLSGYEKKRGMAIEKSMSGKKFGGAIKGFGAARRKGMGLQDEMMKPGKVMNAKRGRMTEQKKKKSEFGAYNKLRDVIDQKQKRKQRMDDFMKDRKKIIEKKKGIPVKKGGMMKYSKGGGADTGRMGEIKSKLATSSDKFKRFFKPRKKLEAPKRRPMKPLNKNLKKFAQTSKLTPTGIGKLGAKKVTGKMGGGMMMLMKKAKDKGAKPLEFLSPMAMLKRVQGRKMGGGMMQRPMAYKMGGGLKAATKKLKAQGLKKGGKPSVKKPGIIIAIGVGKAKKFPGMKKLMEKNKKGKKNF